MSIFRLCHFLRQHLSRSSSLRASTNSDIHRILLETTERMSTPNEGNEKNQHIPKYIVNKPWYENTANSKEDDDYLGHHRKTRGEIVDYSVAQAGSGIEDKFDVSGAKDGEDYDAKRDRWYGYDLDEWDSVLKNWDKNHHDKEAAKLKKTDSSHQDSDSDTDYELELTELNLTAKDIKKNIKENPLEKTVRDRRDIASYIHNITSNPDNKIHIDYDPKSRMSKDLTKGLINDDDQFVRRVEGEGQKLQKFAWEINKQDEQENKDKLMRANLTNEEVDTSVNLQHNLEASPTLMMLKAKKHAQQQKELVDLKKQALLDKYGSNRSVKYEDNQITESMPDT